MSPSWKNRKRDIDREWSGFGPGGETMQNSGNLQLSQLQRSGLESLDVRVTGDVVRLIDGMI